LDLDNGELLWAVMHTQCQLDEPYLGGFHTILAGFYLVESDLAWLAPGEDVEEASERSAIGRPQSVEDFHGPGRCAGLGERLDSRNWEPLGAQFAAVTVDPDAVPAVVSQVIRDRQFGA
jgi:hypothetical protein